MEVYLALCQSMNAAMQNLAGPSWVHRKGHRNTNAARIQASFPRRASLSKVLTRVGLCVSTGGFGENGSVLWQRLKSRDRVLGLSGLRKDF